MELARTLRPAASIPGVRSWAELDATANGALVGVGPHLALQPPADLPAAQVDAEAEADGVPLVAGYRLRLTVITAAHDTDTPTAAALLHQGQRQGLDPSWLLAVAARHSPPPHCPCAR